MQTRRVLRSAVTGVALAAVCTAAASAETLTVGIVDYGGQSLNFLKNAIIPAFEAAHPGVQVQLVTGTWDTWPQKIKAAYAAGNLPDVFQAGSEWIGEMVPTGIAQPIDAFVRDWPDLKDFPKVEIEDATFQGHIYDVPYRLDMRTLTYRKDIFAKFGLDKDAPPGTWDELAQTAKKLTQIDNNGKMTQTGFSISNNTQQYALFLFEAGGHLFSEDYRTSTISDAPAVAAAQFVNDLVNKWNVSTPTGGGGPHAMEYAGDWMMANTDPNIEIGIAVPPKGPANDSGALFLNKWMMGSQTKDPKLAWDWIAFVSQADNMAKIAAQASQLPPRLSMLRYSPWSDDPRWATYFRAVANTQPFRAGVPELATVLYDAGYLGDTLAAILQNRISVGNAMTTLGAKVQADLDDYWKQFGK